MNKIHIYIGGLAIALSLFSCSEEKKEIKRPFEDVYNIEDHLSDIQSGLTKKVYSSESIESQIITQPNWKVELKPFMEADFNRSANKDKYLKTVQESNLMGWKDVTWVSTSENSEVKWAVYRYKDTNCIGAILEVSKNSEGYDLTERLTFIPEMGYSIENEQSLKFIVNENFFLSGEFNSKPQPWRMFFDIGNQIIPVSFYLNTTGKTPSLTFHQGKEEITTQFIKTDSGFVAEMPVFQSYLFINYLFEDSINGAFHNLDKGDDYVINFTGTALPYSEVLSYDPTNSITNISGKWEVYFDNKGDQTPAIGIFNQLGDDIYGTFATETGDYRHLQGKIIGNSFSFSTFDGSHLFLFTGTIKNGEITDGQFFSGNHFHETWTAKRNPNFELTSPDKLTQLTQEKFDFTFPDINGKLVSLSDSKFENKVVILQIMGSWCPNCMDESLYFTELYKKYNSEGLEIIGLSFERSKDFEKAQTSLKKALKDLNIPYTVLIAGTPKESGEVLPMIDKVMSYPTSIFLTKEKSVAKVHTGFYGPGTGAYYIQYTQETDSLIQELLHP